MTSTTPPSTILRTAFLAESALNLASALPTLLTPATLLSFMVRQPSHVNSTSAFLIQATGVLLIAATVPLLRGLQESSTVAERKLAYVALGVGELVSVPILVGKWWAWSDTGSGSGSGSEVGQREDVLLGMAAMLAGILGWRVWCLGWRPQWFEFGETKAGKSL